MRYLHFRSFIIKDISAEMNWS